MIPFPDCKLIRRHRLSAHRGVSCNMPARWAETCSTLSIHHRSGGMLSGPHVVAGPLTSCSGATTCCYTGVLLLCMEHLCSVSGKWSPKQKKHSTSQLLGLPMLPWLQIVSLVFYLPVLSAYFNEPTEWSDQAHFPLGQLHSPV